MDRKMLVVTCIAVVSLAASVTAHSSYQSDTPLYTVRMEQACSEMHFLPTATTAFTYTALQGCTLDYDIQKVENTDTTPNATWYNLTYCYFTCYWRTCRYNTCNYPTCKRYTCEFITCEYYTCYWPTCKEC